MIGVLIRERRMPHEDTDTLRNGIYVNKRQRLEFCCHKPRVA